MVSEITVKFMEVQNCSEELYRSTTKPHRVYVRQPSNINGDWYKGERDGKTFWLSSIKWQGGYEADCPLKDGLTVNVVDKDGKAIFSETLHTDTFCGGTSAEQTAPFVWEVVSHIAEEFAKEHKLSDYYTWKEKLLKERERYNYTDYEDNWLFFEADTVSEKKVARITECGKTFRVIEEHRKHRISGTEWTQYYLSSEPDEIEEICGYILK